MGTMIIIILTALLLSNANGELIVANVTKVQENKTIQSLPAVKSLLTNVSKVAISPTRSQKIEESFSSPKAISVNANNNDIFSSLPLPPLFQFLGTDGLEESLTYQVKKHNKPSYDSPIYTNEELNGLKNQIRKQAFDEIRDYVNELHFQLNSKIGSINESIALANTGAKRNNSAMNFKIDQLNSEVYNLSILSKEATRSMRALQYAQDLERTAFHSQISNLTGQIEKLLSEKNESIKTVMESLSTLQQKMENTTKELRVHEAYIRYGQQVTAAMKSSIDKNEEKIIGLQSDGDPQHVEQTVGCGGVVIGNSGIIAYKFRQSYSDNERCVWIIRANRRSKINLQLLEDGFQNQSNSDFLTVTEFAGEDTHPVTLLTSSRLEHGNKVIHTFQGPVIFLTFYSDSSITGNGFILKFEGTGNRTDATSINAVRYASMHFTTYTGSFRYPKSGMTYQPNELLAVAINPYDANSVKIHMKVSDLEKDEYCEFDSINFYGSVTGSYALTKRYCQQSDELSGEIVQSSDGIFLVIFRSDASTQFSGFQFSWEAE